MKKFVILTLILSTIAFSHVMRKGDLMGVSIYTLDGNVIDRTFLVDEDGFAPVPFVGTMKVSGMDSEALERMIRSEISRIHPDAVVTVYLVKPAPERVFFHGAVISQVDLSELKIRRLSQVLAYVGNLKSFPDSDLSSVRVIRDGKMISVDMERFLETGDGKYDLELQDGDVVVIPRIGKVGIFGAVLKSGFFEYRTGMKLLDLISTAGGLLDNADEEKISIFRKSEKMTVRFEDLISGKDVDLEKGDIVFVPKLEPVYVYVYGYVRSPGLVEFLKQKPTLSKAVAMRGGFIDESKVKSVEIFRDGREIVLKRSSDTVLENGDLVKVVSYDLIRIYVYGAQPGYVEFYENEDPDLRKVLSRIDFRFTGKDVYDISVLRDGKEIYEHEVSRPSEVPRVKLRDGDVVFVEYVNPVSVYVSGYVRRGGLVTFLPFEKPSLSNLIHKVSPTVDEGKVYLTRKGKTRVYDLRSILKGATDTILESWDLVYVDRALKGRVHVVGGRVGEVELEDGISKLSDVVSISARDFNSYREVYLVRSDGEKLSFDFENVIERREDVDLDDGDIVILVPKTEKRVYVVGDVSRELIFQPDESVSTETILSKLSLSENEVESIEGDLKDGIFRIKLRKPVMVYITGDVSKAGGVTLKSGEAYLKEALYMAGLLVEKGKVEIRRKGVSKIYDLEDVLKSDIKLEDGDYIVVRGVGWVSVVGARPSKVSLDSVGTLSDLVSKVDMSFIPEKVEVLRQSTVISMNFEDSVSSKFELKDGDIVVFKSPKEKIVYVVGDLSRAVVFKPGERMDEDSLISKLGLDEKDVESLEGRVEDGNVVRIRIKKPVNVYVSGVGEGPIEFKRYESHTLKDLMGRLGVNLKDLKVSIFRDGTSISFEGSSVISDFELKDGDFVVLSYPEDRIVYVVGDLSKVLIFKPGEKMSKDVLISKLGVQKDSVESIEGELKDGGIVRLKIKKPVRVYVSGDVLKGGELNLEPEAAKLSDLLGTLGIGEGYVIDLISDRSFMTFRSEDVLKGKIDVRLKDGDVIVLRALKVAVEGYGFVDLSKVEKLSDVLKLSKIDTFKVHRIVLWRDGKRIVIDPEDVLSGKNDPNLEDGDFVSFEFKKDRIVYVVGDLSAVVRFSWNEPMNEDTLLSKLGIPSDKIYKIEGEIEDGSVVKVILKKIVRVYVAGRVKRPGMIEFSFDEAPTLRNLVAKVGGLEREVKYVEVFRQGRSVGKFSKDEIYSGEFYLRDGDFVRFKEREEVRIRVFGEGVRQGLYVLEEGSKLADLIAKMGGFEREVSKITLYRKGEVKSFDVSYDEIPDLKLQDGDTLVFGKVEDGFVYVLGYVRSPGAVFVGSEEVPLLRILGMVGGLSDWSSRSKIIVRRGGMDIDIDLKDLDSISNFKVSSGDIIYVPPLSLRRVYVLGAVNRPGIVSADYEVNLLDAILRSGGFKKGADEGRVYVFRGGVEGPVEIYDMSWFRKGKAGKNPILKPGDIVFVPDNTITSITEVIGVVNTMLGFLNNVIGTYRNVEGIMGR